MASNLPIWRGAEGAYRRAYRILDSMAKAGHVKRGHRQCFPSQEMRDIIDALNKGDEATIKYNNLVWAKYDQNY